MKQKIVATLSCGVELRDTMEGVFFTCNEPGREFSFPLFAFEMDEFVSYISAYKTHYQRDVFEEKSGPAQMELPLTYKAKEDAPRYTAEDLIGRTATQTVPLKIGDPFKAETAVNRSPDGKQQVFSTKLVNLADEARKEGVPLATKSS